MRGVSVVTIVIATLSGVTIAALQFVAVIDGLAHPPKYFFRWFQNA
jgi:hypothetical protein